MTPLALLLVLMAAVGHAVWNYLTKSSRYQATFLWLMLLATGLIYAVPFSFRLETHPMPAEGWYYILATAGIHSFYFLLLGLAYDENHGLLGRAFLPDPFS